MCFRAWIAETKTILSTLSHFFIGWDKVCDKYSWEMFASSYFVTFDIKTDTKMKTRLVTNCALSPVHQCLLSPGSKLSWSSLLCPQQCVTDIWYFLFQHCTNTEIYQPVTSQARLPQCLKLNFINNLSLLSPLLIHQLLWSIQPSPPQCIRLKTVKTVEEGGGLIAATVFYEMSSLLWCCILYMTMSQPQTCSQDTSDKRNSI